jgi:hypothetical protein
MQCSLDRDILASLRDPIPFPEVHPSRKERAADEGRRHRLGVREAQRISAIDQARRGVAF